MRDINEHRWVQAIASPGHVRDGLTECLIYFAILFGPWAFGTTQPWSIQVMNTVGLALGLLLSSCCSSAPRAIDLLRWANFSSGFAIGALVG